MEALTEGHLPQNLAGPGQAWSIPPTTAQRNSPRVLRYIIGQPANDAIITERIKLVAGGCQLIAVGTFIASIVAPIFNPIITTTVVSHVMGGLGFAIFELLALRILGYIPSSKED